MPFISVINKVCSMTAICLFFLKYYKGHWISNLEFQLLELNLTCVELKCSHDAVILSGTHYFRSQKSAKPIHHTKG